MATTKVKTKKATVHAKPAVKDKGGVSQKTTKNITKNIPTAKESVSKIKATSAKKAAIDRKAAAAIAKSTSPKTVKEAEDLAKKILDPEAIPPAALVSPEDDREVNISQIEFRLKEMGTSWYRATIVKRLKERGFITDEDNKDKKRFLEKKFWWSQVLPIFEKDTKKNSEQLRLITANADLKEMELQERRGELLPRADVEQLLQRFVTSTRQEFRFNQPAKLVPKIRKAKNLPEAIKIAQTTADEYFDGLLKNPLGILEEKI